MALSVCHVKQFCNISDAILVSVSVADLWLLAAYDIHFGGAPAGVSFTCTLEDPLSIISGSSGVHQ